MSEYIFKPLKTVFTYYYDISGNDVKDTDITKIVAKEVKDTFNGDSFFIRLDGGKPVHHTTFKNSPVINPSYAKVSKEDFRNFIEYLETKKEGLYKSVEYSLKNIGVI